MKLSSVLNIYLCVAITMMFKNSFEEFSYHNKVINDIFISEDIE